MDVVTLCDIMDRHESIEQRVCVVSPGR